MHRLALNATGNRGFHRLFALVLLVLGIVLRFPALRISSIVIGLGERVGNLLAAVDGADKNEEGASGDNESERARGFVALVIYARVVSITIFWPAPSYLGILPRTVSCPSSRTRFISAS